MLRKVQIRRSAVNVAIAAAGGKERLMKGKDYFYFAEGDSAKWPRTMVNLYRLNAWTLERWVACWREYRDEYEKAK